MRELQRTLLLVEDDGAVRALLERWLRLKGFRVLSAGTAREARALWNDHASSIALLLADVVLPGGMSGYTLARELQSENSELNVILMSGYNTERAELAGMIAPRTQFLAKPYQPAQLQEAMSAVFGAALTH